MNIFHQTLRDHLSDKQKAVVLLSGTCKGNDPTLPLCPLLHGSLGPMLFSDIDSEIETKLQSLFLNSNNITWSNHVYFPSDKELCAKICGTLSKTRYSSCSIKSVGLHINTLAASVAFIKSHCQAVEEFRDIALTRVRRPRIDWHTTTDRTEIKDTDLELLSQLTFIKKLQLSGNFEITNDGLLHLSKISSLQHLNLYHCDKITNDGLDHLSELSSLQHLYLNHCNKITDDGLLHLSKLSSLQYIYVSCCREITDDGLVHLSKLSLLQHLALRYCKKICDDGLQHLFNMPSLDPEEVDVFQTAVTIEGFEAFKKQLLENQARAKTMLAGQRRCRGD